MIDTVAKLREYGITLRNYAPGDHKIPCPKCSHERKKKSDPCLSVKIEEDGGATWNCHHCPWADGFAGEDRMFQKRRPPPKPARRHEERKVNRGMAGWFEKRGISERVWRAAGCFLCRAWFPTKNAEDEAIAFPYAVNGFVVNHKYRSADKHFSQDRGARNVVYGYDEAVASGEDWVIWAEGEMDVLSYREAGYQNVVSLKDGTPGSPTEDGRRFDAFRDPEISAWLLGLREVVISADDDEKGGYLAQNLARRFGAEKCSTVFYPEGARDPNEVLLKYGKEGLDEMIVGRRAWPIEGIEEFVDHRDAVHALISGNYRPPLSTGFTALDKGVLKLRQGAFYAVTGEPGDGKSTFMNQVVINTINLHRWRWLYVSFEHDDAENRVNLLEPYMMAPLDLKRWPVDTPSRERIDAAMSELADFIFIGKRSPNVDVPFDLDWTERIIRLAVFRYGVNAVTIDPFNKLEHRRGTMSETDYIGFFLNRMTALCRELSISIFIVAHPRKMDRGKDGEKLVVGPYDIAGSGHWYNMPDGVISIFKIVDEVTRAPLATQFHVLKVKNQKICGSGGMVEAQFDRKTNTFYGKGSSWTEDASPAVAMPYRD